MNGQRHILIIDDEPAWVELISRELKRHSLELQVARDGKSAMDILREGFDGVILLDLQLPDGFGLDLVSQFLHINPALRVVVTTAHGTSANERRARDKGVYLFVSKSEPLERFVMAVDNAFQDRQQAEEILRYRNLVQTQYQFRTIKSKSPQMKRFFDVLERVIESKVTVLIQGESGTGKELVARALHYGGPRKNAPFIAVNCGGIPENLLESELFGHEKGAFTGAVAQQKGRFEQADGGTLFLDEIGEMPLHLQVKILRVLQERKVERIGGRRPQPVDVRVISATHRDLKQMIQEGAFREDLYYRLAVFPVSLPPLREREGDVALLAHHFLKKTLQDENKTYPSRISREAMALLEAYPFPGNVRELENIMNRAVLLGASEELLPQDLPEALNHALPPHAPAPSGRTFGVEPRPALSEVLEWLFPSLLDIPSMDDFEEAILETALKRSEGNMKALASTLGLSRATLYRRLKKLNEEEMLS